MKKSLPARPVKSAADLWRSNTDASVLLQHVQDILSAKHQADRTECRCKMSAVRKRYRDAAQ